MDIAVFKSKGESLTQCQITLPGAIRVSAIDKYTEVTKYTPFEYFLILVILLLCHFQKINP